MQTTIDHSQTEHFARLANSWWDPDGPFWPLHRLNQLRIKWITEQLGLQQCSSGPTNQPLRGLTVLDIGCGGGLLSEAMASRGATVTGIDPVARNIDIASRHVEGKPFHVTYECRSASDYLKESTRFDVVLNMEVIEHVSDWRLFMSHACQLVKPGGRHFVATINRTPLAWLIAIVGAEHILRWMPKGTHHYGKLVKPDELEHTLYRHHSSVIARTGVQMNPLTRNLRLVGSESINYMLMAQHNP